MRYAIYYTPPENEPLTRAAAQWLGRCAFTGKDFSSGGAGGLSASVLAGFNGAPRRYGFHATLMAPFTLAEGESEENLVAALAAFSGGTHAFEVPKLALARLDSFLALVPETRHAGLDRLAADVTVAFDRFRAPLDAAEITRRSAAGLTAAQHENLVRWGYPYVFEDFRFHMTLSDSLDDTAAGRAHRAAEAHFGQLLAEPLTVASIALFIEPEKGAPFLVRSFHEFGTLTERKTA